VFHWEKPKRKWWVTTSVSHDPQEWDHHGKTPKMGGSAWFSNTPTELNSKNWNLINTSSGWWCNNHLEKYEFVNGKDFPIYYGK